MSSTDRGPTLQDRIIGLIHEQQLAPGSAMPTEPQLVELLGASRNSVREAMRALQALGIVEVRHGRGTFVGEAPLRVLTPSLAFHIRSRSGGTQVAALSDLVGVRELLEVGLVSDIASTIAPATLDELEGVAQRTGKDPKADRAFHSLLFTSCGNDLVLELIQLFWSVYHELENAVEPPEDRAEAIVANHLAIVAALRTGDAEAACQAMRRHFSDVKARVARAEEFASGR